MTGSLARRGRWGERLAEWTLKASGALAAAAVFALISFVLYNARSVVSVDGLAQLAHGEWAPHRGLHGILPMLVGSLGVAVLAVAIAFPWALGICCFAHGLAPARLGRLLLALVHFMTSIPTIVYAFVSAIVLPPLLRGAFDRGSGFSLLGAGLTLSVLILPTVVLLIDAGWRSAAPSLRLTCRVLGLTRPQELICVLLPASRNGLIAAAILGFGRALGDTMIALLLSGNAPQMPGSWMDPVRTLTAHVALVAEMDTEHMAYRSVFAAGLLLLLTTAVLNFAIRRVSGRSGGAAHANVVG